MVKESTGSRPPHSLSPSLLPFLFIRFNRPDCSRYRQLGISAPSHRSACTLSKLVKLLVCQCACAVLPPYFTFGKERLRAKRAYAFFVADEFGREVVSDVRGLIERARAAEFIFDRGVAERAGGIGRGVRVVTMCGVWQVFQLAFFLSAHEYLQAGRLNVCGMIGQAGRMTGRAIFSRRCSPGPGLIGWP